MALKETPYNGAGVVYLGGRDIGAIGNVRVLEELEEVSIPNVRTGNGNWKTRQRVSSVRVTGTLHDLNVDNIAMVVRGSTTAVTSASVTDEAVTAVLDGLAEVNDMIDTADVANTVTVTDSGATTTYVLNDDYLVTPAGIKALSTGAITEGESLLVDYTKKAANVVEALVSGGVEARMVIDAVNTADGDTPMILRFHRAEPKLIGELPVIGDGSAEYTSVEVEFEIYADETRPSGESQFYNRTEAA